MMDINNNKNKELEIINLSKKYGNKVIFNNLNIQIPKGKSIGIMGPSGTGKSVLLKCILGLTDYEGKILYEGTLLDKRNRKDLYNQSGMLFQNGALFDSLNVWQNITFKLINAVFFYSTVNCLLVAKKMLNQVELGDDILQNMPSELSGGMQKRVALARAIVNDPSILFFDEPTTGLDPLTAKSINNLIFKLTKNNVTSLIISHDPISIQKICDEVIFLIDGIIEWQGNIKEMSASKHKMLKDYLNSKN